MVKRVQAQPRDPDAVRQWEVWGCGCAGNDGNVRWVWAGKLPGHKHHHLYKFIRISHCAAKHITHNCYILKNSSVCKKQLKVFMWVTTCSQFLPLCVLRRECRSCCLCFRTIACCWLCELPAEPKLDGSHVFEVTNDITLKVPVELMLQISNASSGQGGDLLHFSDSSVTHFLYGHFWLSVCIR